MTIKTYTLVRTRPSNDIPFYPAYVAATNPTLSANIIAHHSWISTQPGVISFTPPVENANSNTFTSTLVYDDGVISEPKTAFGARQSIYSENLSIITAYYQLHNITTQEFIDGIDVTGNR